MGEFSGKQVHCDHKLVNGLDITMMNVGWSSSSHVHL